VNGVLSRLVARLTAAAVRNRSRLPRFLDAIVEDVARNPDGLAGRIASAALGGGRLAGAPPPTSVPSETTRVYVGATNYAGQGYLWARALERSGAIGARNLAVELPGGFAFPADTLVSVATFNRDRKWQEKEYAAALQFTHVLNEAERPMFGNLFGREVEREVDALRAEGVSVAFLAHGTDLRSPRRNRELTPWSQFHESSPRNDVLQEDADRNVALLDRLGLPVFVSTPDLLLDYPSATWCPVVVDPAAWTGGRDIMSAAKPVIVHVPSMGPAKGTHLIEATVISLAATGAVEFRQLAGLESALMSTVIGEADIVLDQFRVGSYGVGACEGMAAGRVVVGHVVPLVREHVLAASGRELPIVEATPDTLGDVLTTLIADPDEMRRIGERGREFVAHVHSGALSAGVLRKNWIDT
jgi:hypothetical protein